MQLNDPDKTEVSIYYPAVPGRKNFMKWMGKKGTIFTYLKIIFYTFFIFFFMDKQLLLVYLSFILLVNLFLKLIKR